MTLSLPGCDPVFAEWDIDPDLQWTYDITASMPFDHITLRGAGARETTFYSNGTAERFGYYGQGDSDGKIAEYDYRLLCMAVEELDIRELRANYNVPETCRQTVTLEVSGPLGVLVVEDYGRAAPLEFQLVREVFTSVASRIVWSERDRLYPIAPDSIADPWGRFDFDTFVFECEDYTARFEVGGAATRRSSSSASGETGRMQGAQDLALIASFVRRVPIELPLFRPAREPRAAVRMYRRAEELVAIDVYDEAGPAEYEALRLMVDAACERIAWSEVAPADATR